MRRCRPPPSEPSRLCPSRSPADRLFEPSVRDVLRDALIVPGRMLSGSDASHLAAVTDHGCRRRPIRFENEDLPRVHGTDGRIAVDPRADMVRVYHRLLSQAAQ